MQNYSVEDVEKFMDWSIEKGQIKRNTGIGRKTAVSKILGQLDPDERADVRTIDLKSAFDRWQNKEGAKYGSDSLAVYESRVKSAIAEFLSYKLDPKSYKPATQARTSRATITKVKSGPATVKGEGSVSPGISHGGADELPEGPTGPPVVFSLPIRPGVSAWVRITGLPKDLTEQEAKAAVEFTKLVMPPMIGAAAHPTKTGG